jgi:hypothetical protein
LSNLPALIMRHQKQVLFLPSFKLFCEGAFQEWTLDGIMRAPSFLGLGDDKEPKQWCHRPLVVGGTVNRSLNRPQWKRLPCFKPGISVVKKIKPTVVTGAGERLGFSES